MRLRIDSDVRNWHREARQALGSNARFVREERQGLLILRQRTPAAEAALAFLLPDPDQAFDHSHILKPGSRSHVGVVEIAGVRYVLKRYNCRGWGYRIGNAFRRSRAVRTWLATWQYLVRGIPVPEPLLCLEERRFRLLGRSYILMEFVENAVSLLERWKQLTDTEKVRFGEFFGTLLGTMHRVGMLHGDLKWNNIMVTNEPTLETVRLVDLDGSAASGGCNFPRARKDLNRFLKDLDREEGSVPLRNRVIEAWQKAVI
ncbi:lipopolysaccharide kinase InaA family protein [Geobacter sp.]|uniref:lipopolysaccharide kinase InaA family protein n=1 Tax=Geobacter sp. TaxID=46610 RepID=UPI0027B8815C|nr:lipopolysaccharide kinase InaA family protein [Geobacter sp.]